MTEFRYSLETKTSMSRQYLERKLKRLIEYSYRNVPSVRARLERAGVTPSQISTVKGLERLPVLRKDELVDMCITSPPFGGLVTIPIKNLQRVYVSPGPIFDPHPQSRSFWNRYMEGIRGLGFGHGDIVINTLSYHLVPAGLWFDEALRLAGATVIPTGIGNTELQVEIIHRLGVTGFIGSANFLMNIVKKAEQTGYDVQRDFKLRLAFAGGEMGVESIRQLIERDYGISTRDAYATAEGGMIAYECGQKRGMHIGQEIIVEIVDPSSGKQLGPGETGEVVITTFDKGHPLVRFGTGDLSAYTEEPCSCGRDSPRLIRIMGRVGEAVRIRGMFVHPRQVERVLSRFTEVLAYQATVTRSALRDEVTLLVELANNNEEIDRSELTAKLSEAFNEAARVRVDSVRFVAKGVIPQDHKLIVDERTY